MAGPQYLAMGKKKPATAPSPSMIGTANSAPRPDGKPGMTPMTPAENLAPAPFQAQMTPADKLIMDARDAGIGQAAQTAASTAAAGNAGLNALQGQILGTPVASVGTAPNFAAARQAGLGSAPTTTPLLRNGPVATAPATQATRFAPRAAPQPAATPSALATGVGQGSINEVDAALTGFDPRFNMPGTVSRAGVGARGEMGGIADRSTLGAMPGETDRSLQLSALDRMLGFDPSVGTSVAQAQLRDAAQGNLSQSLALARSARGGPAAQAQAMRMAQAEGAATMSQAARDAAILRAKEEDTRKARELEALGLGGELSTQIRGSDVLERQQNVGALEAELQAGVEQRGQENTARIEERKAGVTERGQEEAAKDAALNAGVTQRGQTIGAEQTMNQAELDALVARGGLAQTERQVGAQERGQTLDAILGTEQVKQARDAVASAALTESEKTEANILMTRAQLGYQLTPEQQFRAQAIANKANDPTLLQYIMGGISAVANTGQTVASIAKGG